MPQKILLAFDGSDHSLKAADYALDMAKKSNAYVEIIYVYETPPVYSDRVVYDVAKMKKEVLENAMKVITQGVEKFIASDVPYTSKIVSGDPAEVICAEAEQSGTTEIVIGSRGMNVMSRFFLGSVSLKVLTHAPCTTIIVK